MKYYGNKIIVAIMFILLFSGCGHREGGGKASPSPTALPMITQKPTPSLSAAQRFELEEQEREKIKEDLMASPTPGPEPYSIFDAKKSVEVGDVVIMGNYIHLLGRDIEDYDLPTKWLVLEKNEEKVLLISLFNVDVKRYIEGDTYIRLEKDGIPITWATSNVRQWLNGRFKEYAFNFLEQECILETVVHTPDNPIYGTEGGEDTNDCIFLLSIDEVQKYFSSDTERRTQIIPDVDPIDEIIYGPSEHRPNTTDYYDWWLRSPGKSNYDVACVERYGEVVLEGVDSTNMRVSVRPAMWIDLNKVKEVGLEMAGEE